MRDSDHVRVGVQDCEIVRRRLTVLVGVTVHVDPDWVPRDSVRDPERVLLLGVCVDLLYVYVKADVADELNVCVAVMLGTSEMVGVGVARDPERVGDGDGERLMDLVWLGVRVCEGVGRLSVVLGDMEGRLGVAVEVETRDKEREPVGEPRVLVLVLVGEPEFRMLEVAVSLWVREPGDFVDVTLFEALGVEEPVAVAVAVGVAERSWVDVHVPLPVGLLLGLWTQDTVDDGEKLCVRVGL